jgi:hypothetical protein
MASNIFRHYQKFDETQIVNRVLLNAGHQGTASPPHLDARGDAARFLLEQYSGGVNTEAGLTTALQLRFPDYSNDEDAVRH